MHLVSGDSCQLNQRRERKTTDSQVLVPCPIRLVANFTRLASYPRHHCCLLDPPSHYSLHDTRINHLCLTACASSYSSHSQAYAGENLLFSNIRILQERFQHRMTAPPHLLRLLLARRRRPSTTPGIKSSTATSSRS